MVAEGATKPTSVYSVVRVEDKLVVVAHLSEGIPRFWLIDQVSLDTFVSNELDYGLRLAVEAKVLADVNGTSGIQTQAYATSVLTVLRKSITKLETTGAGVSRNGPSAPAPCPGGGHLPFPGACDAVDVVGLHHSRGRATALAVEWVCP